MRQFLTFVALLLITVLACAQATPQTSKRDKLAIDKAKTVLVSMFDKNLPKVTLEYFLTSESDGRKIEWEVNDCGEQTGNPAVDRGRDFPLCVEARVSARELRTVSVRVAVGTHNKGVTGGPELFSVTVTDEAGAVHDVKLFDVPAEMHRGRPTIKKGPRDLPAPSRPGMAIAVESLHSALFC